MPEKKLYLFILGLAFTGYSWVLLNQYVLQPDRTILNVCLFRKITGIPCPSCGTTHAVLSITKGEFMQALHENILGFPAVLALIILPAWIITDLVRKKQSFYRAYTGAESFLRKKWVAWTALAILLANWVWIIANGG